MDARELLDEVYEAVDLRPRDALALGNAERHAIEGRDANPEDAETCRLLMLAASTVGEYATAGRWRALARARAEALDWPEFTASLDISEALRLLAVRNRDYANGYTLDVIEGEPQSLELIAEVEAVASGIPSGIQVTPRSPSAAILRRSAHDKRGTLELALRRWDAAEESFTRALAVAESARGTAKARAGIALATYCAGLESDDTAAIEQALAQTRAIADEATARDVSDIRATALHNAEAMARRGRDLLLYEIL